MSAVTLGRVVRSESIKLVSLRSTVTSYLVISFAMVGLAGVCLTLPKSQDGSASSAVLTGLLLVELLVGITGILAASNEYSAQTIRSTLTAVPRRLPVLAAKLLVHGGLVVTLLILATFAAMVVGGIVAPESVGSLADREVVRALLGTIVTLSGVCVLGVAFGALTRSAAAGIGILFTVMFLPVLVVTAPEITAFLPGRAVQAIVLSDNPPEAQLLAPGVAVLVFLTWLLAAVVGAAVALGRRDA
jgi:ABC-type transport system involved in multi-copper enzyme maturation permease subunit